MVKNYFVKASRKNAIARCMSKAGTGKVRVNGHSLEAYYSGYKQGLIKEPMILLNEEANKLDYFVNVSGGGVMSQVQATRSCIAKSILAANNREKVKDKIMTYDRHLLVDDVRRKEPKHQLGKGARKKKQHSKRWNNDLSSKMFFVWSGCSWQIWWVCKIDNSGEEDSGGSIKYLRHR